MSIVDTLVVHPNRRQGIRSPLPPSATSAVAPRVSEVLAGDPRVVGTGDPCGSPVLAQPGLSSSD
jgi:hypothetical protein